MKHIETVEEFEQVTKKGACIVDFYASWCGPCQMLGPVLQELEELYPTLTIVKVDVDAMPVLASRFLVSSIPYIVFFKDGGKVADQLGFLPKPSLEKLIKKVYAL